MSFSALPSGSIGISSSLRVSSNSAFVGFDIAVPGHAFHFVGARPEERLVFRDVPQLGQDTEVPAGLEIARQRNERRLNQLVPAPHPSTLEPTVENAGGRCRILRVEQDDRRPATEREGPVRPETSERGEQRAVYRGVPPREWKGHGQEDGIANVGQPRGDRLFRRSGPSTHGFAELVDQLAEERGIGACPGPAELILLDRRLRGGFLDHVRHVAMFQAVDELAM